MSRETTAPKADAFSAELQRWYDLRVAPPPEIQWGKYRWLGGGERRDPNDDLTHWYR